jgi:DNA-binding SARP family transcriptional activator/TolB-like protein/Tfp pilus assembly protein PilF
MGGTVGENVGSGASLQVQILGPFSIRREGTPLPLPRSRKVRALLAFLALGATSYSRSRLCDLLWDVPNDPRGELRWCLSKLRALLDDPHRRRVQTTGHGPISLDLSDCIVDAIEIERAVKAGTSQATTERLSYVCDLFGGDLLEGVEIDGNPEFAGWLIAQRQRYREMKLSLLRELIPRLPRSGEQTFRRLDQWLVLAPFDLEAHAAMLDVLHGCGRARDGEQHVATAIRAFEHEGIDWAPLRALLASRKSSAESPRTSPRAATAVVEEPSPEIAKPRRRASVAIMPFAEVATGADLRRLADGLTDDIITRLAKLRVLFVIARGTTYALDGRGIGAQEAGRILDVEYVVSGSVRTDGRRFSVMVELAETRRATIVWRDVLETSTDGTFAALDAVVDRLVAGIAEEIETAECNRAILQPPSSLDAWETYHRGLWHMYKFTDTDNRHAADLFERAVQLDPTFARAWAGLSFTHFQNVFLNLRPDRRQQIELALRAARRSVDADDRDPAAHWAMGRALWLGDESTGAFAELERSVALSPNFALGHYTLGFFHGQVGDPRAAIAALEYSTRLSPFDPLLFGMLASRAVSHLRLGEYQEAADWAAKAAGRPNAHVHILAVAAACSELAGRRDDARRVATRIHERLPGYTTEDFLRAFRFDADTQRALAGSLHHLGLDLTR